MLCYVLGTMPEKSRHGLWSHLSLSLVGERDIKQANIEIINCAKCCNENTTLCNLTDGSGLPDRRGAGRTRWRWEGCFLQGRMAAANVWNWKGQEGVSSEGVNRQWARQRAQQEVRLRGRQGACSCLHHHMKKVTFYNEYSGHHQKCLNRGATSSSCCF